ncbi:hypothetical protein TIFTF001_012473 [Ficus carica]|uniref:Uncharacterized protein n=1 Tax=Ficus carica TaxID=3494 RepID=A0AA88D592_FICCA|nr:hypothetical protein TIFTF001_012473 [Ficus carica]
MEIAISPSSSSSQSLSTLSPATASAGDGHGGKRRSNFDGRRCRKSSINRGWVTAKLGILRYLRLCLCLNLRPRHLQHQLLAATAMAGRGDRTSTTDGVTISQATTTSSPTTMVSVLRRS